MTGRLVAGRYRLDEVLGRGGMGVVWAGHDTVLDRTVAVKEVVPPREADDAERVTLRDRTLREARTAARISAEGVVAIHDVVEDDDRPWIVMERLPGSTLADVVARRGPLPPQEVTAIADALLAGLAAAHTAGILHRDVKPSNVMFREPETGGRAVLVDFGIAHLDGDATLTATGMMMGSPAYLAPERAQGLPAGPAADLWSLGATLWTAVEGHPPFQRENALATLSAVITEEVPTATRAGALAPLLEGLLRKDPAARLDAPAARELLDGLGPTGLAPLATAALPVHAGTPAPAAEPAPEPAAERPAGPAAGPAPAQVSPVHASSPEDRAARPPGEPRPPVLAPVAAPPDGDADDGRADPDRLRPEPAPARRRRLPLAVPAVLALLAGGVVVGVVALGPDDGGPDAAGPGAQQQEEAPADPDSGAEPPADDGADPAPPPEAPEQPAPEAPEEPAPDASADAPDGDAGDGAAEVPDGMERYTDPTGFSVAVPQGWQAERDGPRVYLRDPASSAYLLVDQTDSPAADPVADWQRQEPAVAERLENYERLGAIEPVDFRGWEAADWEFVFGPGQGTHVLNRNVVTAPDQAYALYWSVPSARWEELLPVHEQVVASFSPAG